MSDMAIIKSKCENFLRALDHQKDKRAVDDAMYELYRQLVLHYTPPVLGVNVQDVIEMKELVCYLFRLDNNGLDRRYQ